MLFRSGAVTVVIAMRDAGFILGAYAATVVVIGGFAFWVLRAGRRSGRLVDDEEKYWT